MRSSSVATHTAPSPTAMATGGGTGKLAVTLSVRGSIRTTRFPRVTQTLPAPVVIAKTGFGASPLDLPSCKTS